MCAVCESIDRDEADFCILILFFCVIEKKLSTLKVQFCRSSRFFFVHSLKYGWWIYFRCICRFCESYLAIYASFSFIYHSLKIVCSYEFKRICKIIYQCKSAPTLKPWRGSITYSLYVFFFASYGDRGKKNLRNDNYIFLSFAFEMRKRLIFSLAYLFATNKINNPNRLDARNEYCCRWLPTFNSYMNLNKSKDCQSIFFHSIAMITIEFCIKFVNFIRSHT